MGDAYGKALDQFTEALSNKGDMYEAWNKVGYIHLRLGAYSESIDDYNHTLALKPELLEAIEHRAEAYMAVDRLDEAKAAYMDLFNHDRPLADQMMVTMQTWLESHRAAANGMRARGHRRVRQVAAGARRNRQANGVGGRSRRRLLSYRCGARSAPLLSASISASQPVAPALRAGSRARSRSARPPAACGSAAAGSSTDSMSPENRWA